MRECLRESCSSWPRILHVIPFVLFACSTLTHYPDQTRDLVSEFEAGESAKAFADAAKHADKGLDRLVYLLESGMILHTRGSMQKSNAVFEEAEEIIQRHEGKALLSLSKGTAQLSSMVVNEKTLPYRGEPFEKVLVNTYKAINYLLLHDYEGARVEIRRSFARQQENRELHEKQLERLEKEARTKGIHHDPLYREVGEHYQDQQEIVHRARNLYEDAFAYYLSAIVYELNREYNDAYIDLKKVQGLQPGVPSVENDLLRMAKLSGLYDMLKAWTNRLGRPPHFVDKTNEGELFVFFGCGMAPRKTQINISIPIPDVGVVSLAFPKYQPVPNPIQYAALHGAGGKSYGRTYVLTDLEAIAIRNLDDRMPTLVLKQVLRATLKGTAVKTARDEGGWAAQLVANIFTAFTEQADLRSWITLPQNIQVARIALPTGAHQLVFALKDKTGRTLRKRPFSLELRPGEQIFLSARSGTSDLIGFYLFSSGGKKGNEVE